MTNNFLPFCPTDTGTNLLTQVEYAAASDRTNGNQPGVASSKLVNRAVRQATAVVSQFAQFLADVTGSSLLDDGVSARMLAQINAAVAAMPPIVSVYTSTSTHNPTFLFFIASGNATVGATYTNNAVTFTVVATVAAATLVKMTGASAPAVSGTLTKSAGTGDATLTFYAYRAPSSRRVRVVGGGGGGGGAATTGVGEAAEGGGGGGGGYAEKNLSTALTTAVTVTIGAGGTAGTAGNNAGGDGGVTSFGTDAVAGPGLGGSGSAATGTSTLNGGGAAGIGTTGDLLCHGSDGGHGRVLSGTRFGTCFGGASILGGGRRSSSAGGVGNAGYTYGGGGSAGSLAASTGQVAGAAGSPGVCVVEDRY